jgi:hypothetical protein
MVRGGSFSVLLTEDLNGPTDDEATDISERHSAMQRLADYLEHARQFERLAAEEADPQIKAQFEKQGASYRKLAERRERFLRAVFPKIQTEPPPSA